MIGSYILAITKENTLTIDFLCYNNYLWGCSIQSRMLSWWGL